MTALAQFAALLSQSQRLAVECFYVPSRGWHTTPSITTFHNILATLEPQTLESAVYKWTRQQSEQVQARKRIPTRGRPPRTQPTAARRCGPA